jgi:cyclin-dependent kinase 7
VVLWQENNETRRRVAIKQVFRMGQLEGVNLGAIKEIQVLTELQHPNIIQLVETFPSKV